MAMNEPTPDLPAHTPGTSKGEERVKRHGREAGRGDTKSHRKARDATSINPEGCAPIDPRMPHLPPA
jgi:hypothetical protein